MLVHQKVGGFIILLKIVKFEKIYKNLLYKINKMSFLYAKFIGDSDIKNSEEIKEKLYQFDEEITVESMLSSFIKSNDLLEIKICNFDQVYFTFFYKTKIINKRELLKMKIKNLFKKEITSKSIPSIHFFKNNSLGFSFINFLSFETYKNGFIFLHQKLSEFFDENYSSLNYKYEYKQNFLNFINSININEKSSIIEWASRINRGTLQEFLQVYTGETPLCYLLNKWLRIFDLELFEQIKYFAGPFSYSLYKYAHDNSKMRINFSKRFYRKMVLKSYDYSHYKDNIGQLICYPAFTSVSERDLAKYSSPNETCIKINNLTSDDINVILYIDYKCNNTSYPTPCIDISYETSNYGEKEYIFPPFSFFRIEKVENRSGTSKDPHIIYMTVPNKRILIEFAIKNNKTIYYDEKLNELYAS